MNSTKLHLDIIFLSATLVTGVAAEEKVPAQTGKEFSFGLDTAVAASEMVAVRANSDFSFDLYAQLAKENSGKNLFFSPYSIATALAMTAEGARGETADQMGKVLRYPEAVRRIGNEAKEKPWEMSTIHEGMSALNEKFNGMNNSAKVNAVRKEIAALKAAKTKLEREIKEKRENKEFTELPTLSTEWKAISKEISGKLTESRQLVDPPEIKVANALWGERTYPFKEEYFKTLRAHYRTAGVFPVDFKGNFENVRLRINGWVEDQTNEKIKDLLPRGALDKLTRLVLVNAIYFKGDWLSPFDEQNTKDLDFTLANGKRVAKPIMHAINLNVARYAAFESDGSPFKSPTKIYPGQKTGLYSGDDGFAVLELPYRGNELAMLVIAPNNPEKLSILEAKLNQRNLVEWIANLKERKVHVFLPKFKMETEYTLGDSKKPATLQKMGMVRAFIDPRDPEGAVFDGMSHASSPMEKLYIGLVVHKAFVEVNEKGTEAAAATGVVMFERRSAPETVPFIPTFRADRPFIYLIRDRVSGSILFMGRMMEPVTK